MEIAAMIFQYAVLGALGGVCVAAWGLVKQYNLEKWVNLAVTAWEMYAPQAKRGEFKKERAVSSKVSFLKLMFGS